MNGEELLKNMDQLDDKLIQSAADANGNGKKYLFIGLVAAVLAALTVTAAAFVMMNKNEVTLPSGTEIATEAETETDTKETVQTAETNEREYKDISDIPGAALYDGRLSEGNAVHGASAYYPDPYNFALRMKQQKTPLLVGTVKNLNSVTVRFYDENDENDTAEWVLCTFDLIVENVNYGDVDKTKIRMFALKKNGGNRTLEFYQKHTVNIDLYDGKQAVFELRKSELYNKFYDEIDLSEFGEYGAVRQFEKTDDYYLELLKYLGEKE